MKTRADYGVFSLLCAFASGAVLGHGATVESVAAVLLAVVLAVVAGVLWIVREEISEVAA
jgi:hypothetical protein